MSIDINKASVGERFPLFGFSAKLVYKVEDDGVLYQLFGYLSEAPNRGVGGIVRIYDTESGNLVGLKKWQPNQFQKSRQYFEICIRHTITIN